MAKQILLVDDSVTIHKVVEITFAREDAKITAIKNGDDAVAKAKEVKADVVLVDANLSGKSGYDVCAALRADGGTAGIACLLLTGNFSPYDEAKGTKAGADGFIVKPFETQALIDKTNDAINKKRAGTGGTVAAAAPTVAAAAPAPAPAPAPPKPAPPPASTMIMDAPKLPNAPSVPPSVQPTMAMPMIASTPPAAPKPAPPPLVAPPKPAAAKSDDVEISIEAPKPVPAPPPLLSKAPTPPFAPPKPPSPPPAKPMSPPAAPQASTMMMDAPKIPVAPATPLVPPVASPKESASAATVMMDAPKLPIPAPAVVATPVVAKPAPAPSPTGRVQITMPASVPQMPRPSLIPNVPMPAPAAKAPDRGPPRATIMGMPAIVPPALTPTPPTPAKPPVAAWAPPRTTSTGMKAVDPAALGIDMPKPEPAETHASPEQPAQKEMSPLVAAVTEKALGEVEREVAAAGGDVTALRPLTKEVIEKIAWEVVPELAEVILAERLKK